MKGREVMHDQCYTLMHLVSKIICFMYFRLLLSVMSVLGREGGREIKESGREPGLLHNQTYNGL